MIHNEVILSDSELNMSDVSMESVSTFAGGSGTVNRFPTSLEMKANTTDAEIERFLTPIAERKETKQAVGLLSFNMILGWLGFKTETPMPGKCPTYYPFASKDYGDHPESFFSISRLRSWWGVLGSQ